MATGGIAVGLSPGWRRLLLLAVALFGVLAAAAPERPVAASYSFVANDTADLPDTNPGDGLCLTQNDDCTLRAAIQEANALGSANAVTIGLVANAVYTLTLTQVGPLDVGSKVAITVVPGGTATVQGASGWRNRIFDIQSGASAQLSGLVITGGNTSGCTGSDCGGGGVKNYGGTLTLMNDIVSGNVAGPGAGIENFLGSLSLTNSTVSGNSGNIGGGILNSDTLTITNSTISGNSASQAAGGIANFGPLRIVNSTISGNTTLGYSFSDGGGILNVDTLTVTNSTVSGNSAARNGGGIWNQDTVAANNATIADNVADSDADGAGDGGGVFNVSGGTVSVLNTIVADNVDGSATTKLPDCAGSLNSRGYNLIENTLGCLIGGDTTGNITSRDPQLGPLQNNGGPTQTQALLIKSAKSCSPPFGCFTYQVPSPAIDFGSPGGSTACTTTDQRGAARPIDGNGDGIARCDIGAFEWPPQQVIVFPLGTWTLTPTGAAVPPGERIAYTFTWTVPLGRGWRSLDTLQLRLFDNQETALWLRFHEVTGAPGVFSVVDAKNGNVGPSFAPGSPNRLESDDASVYLADTSVDGPPGRTVTLTIPLSFKPRAAGHVYDVLLLATDDNGEVQGFHRAGTVTVTR